MRKLLALCLGLGLAMAIILSSCGGGGESGSTTPTKPSISILYLDNTPLVATPLPIQTSANSIVKKYQFFLDNTPLGNPGVATEIIINTSTIPDGTHTIRVKGIATDNTFAEDAKTFLVNKAEIRRQALNYLRQMILFANWDNNGNAINVYRWPNTNLNIAVASQFYGIAEATVKTFNKYCDLNIGISLLSNNIATGFEQMPYTGAFLTPPIPNYSGFGKLVYPPGEIIFSYTPVVSETHKSTQFLVAYGIADTLNINLFPSPSELNLFKITQPLPYLPFRMAEALYIMYHEIPVGGQIPTQ